MLDERFWAKVDKTEACWLWTAAKDANGYGRFGIAGRNCQAHRVAWEAERGPVPTGRQIDHRCRNKACVRVSHMQLVSQQKNRENLSGAYRNNKTGVRGVYRTSRGFRVGVCVKGQKHSGGTYSTLEEAETAAITLRNKLMTNNLLDRSTR